MPQMLGSSDPDRRFLIRGPVQRSWTVSSASDRPDIAPPPVPAAIATPPCTLPAATHATASHASCPTPPPTICMHCKAVVPSTSSTLAAPSTTAILALKAAAIATVPAAT
ncbi:hypothetical protein ACLOJK_039005, partial [Asimina triloba]